MCLKQYISDDTHDNQTQHDSVALWINNRTIDVKLVLHKIANLPVYLTYLKPNVKKSTRWNHYQLHL